MNEVIKEYRESSAQAQEVKDKASELIESTSRGAVDSIHKSLISSDNTSKVAVELEGKLEDKLRPLIKELEGAIEISQEVLNKYDNEVKEALKNTMKNLDGSHVAVSSLNNAVSISL